MADIKMIRKKGQVTLFVILALLLVGIIFFIYSFYVSPKTNSTYANMPPLDKCISQKVNAEIIELGLSAGVLNSNFNSQYQGENYTNLCYTTDYYKPCVVQYPFLVHKFEESLYQRMRPIIQDCYDKAIDDLNSRGEAVSIGKITSSISITPYNVEITVNAPTVSSNDGASAYTKKIVVRTPSDIYNSLSVANAILQFETSYGDSEVSEFMFYYPDLKIEKIRRDNGVKIYIIDNKKDIKYRFATRSYAWPPGYGNAIN